MNRRIKKKKQRIENKKLCERYPFLIPRGWDGRPIWENKNHWMYIHPYSFTELDAMPNGWRKKFGEQMCEEIREELLKENYLDKFRITQLKEKYGTMRLYCWGASKSVYKILNKYEKFSGHVCEFCGRPIGECVVSYNTYGRAQCK